MKYKKLKNLFKSKKQKHKEKLERLFKEGRILSFENTNEHRKNLQ